MKMRTLWLALFIGFIGISLSGCACLGGSWFKCGKEAAVEAPPPAPPPVVARPAPPPPPPQPAPPPKPARN